MFAIFQTFKILQISSYSEYTLNKKFLSLTLAIFETKQPVVRFWELFKVVHFLALFMQGSIKFGFKTSSFQCSSLPLNIVLGFIIIVIILCLDDGIDQKSFCKKCFLNIYFWLVSYFMANLSRKKRGFSYKNYVCNSFYFKKRVS